MWSYSAGGSILAGGRGAFINICLTVHTKVAGSTGAGVVVEPILGEQKKKNYRREDAYEIKKEYRCHCCYLTCKHHIVLLLTTHVAPFRQGAGAHSLMSIRQFVPVHPATHVQL